jgi:hypothetical protein
MAELITTLEGGVKEGGPCGCGATAELGVHRGGEAKRLEMEDGPDRWGPLVGGRKERREGGRCNWPARLTGPCVEREQGEKKRERERERWAGVAGKRGRERKKSRPGKFFFSLSLFLQGVTKPNPLKSISSSRFGKIGKQLREFYNQLIFSFPRSFIL